MNGINSKRLQHADPANSSLNAPPLSSLLLSTHIALYSPIWLSTHIALYRSPGWLTTYIALHMSALLLT